ncbi:MAG: chemotaxis response regulator protein-glutamate methylesterase [Comamonadaceae bacterium]|nr:MAG: chemotaxis response regulator protein-glutamate methylesterase [Comamonadaceae bacterium]
MNIGIVNDSPLAVAALQKMLARDASLRVLWVARDGAQAVAQCAAQRPDIVLMDLMMPVMDGVEATRRIMEQSPCAIVVVTSDVLRHTSSVFEAMGHGALDAVDTPTLATCDERDETPALLRKIRNIGWLIGDRKKPVDPTITSARTAGTSSPLIAIGASAGGPATLAQLLNALPVNFGGSVVMVQHVDAVFSLGMAKWLDEQCAMTVRLACEGDRPIAGTALLAGTNDHLKLRSDGTLGYSEAPREFLYRPSIDVFFDSVIAHWRTTAVGVLLTGMGRDGAEGLKRMRDRGFHTIAQDQRTCAVYGMPKAAAAIGAAVQILPIEDIADALSAQVKKAGPDASQR